MNDRTRLNAVPMALMHHRGFCFDKDGTGGAAAGATSSTAQKWVKLADSYEGPLGKAGEIKVFDAAEADLLVKATLAAITEKPKEVGEAEEAVVKAIDDRMKLLIEESTKQTVAALVKQLSPSGTDSKGKRPHITTHDNADDDPSLGFKNVNEQIRFIRKMCDPNQRVELMGSDDRAKRMYAAVTKAPTTYANEGLGADGGFLLAPQFANEVLMHTFEQESLFSRTNNYTTGSNNLTIPKDETTPWGSSGVQVFWAAEAAQLTQSKPKFGTSNLQLNKLTALVPVTDEQLADSFVGLGQYISRQAGERIMWAADESLVNGSGVGKPLGFINSGALVSVAKESAQTAATINLTNAAKMISRIPSPSLTNLTWLVHPSALPQLMVMTNGNNSLWIGPGEVENKGPVMGRFMGIPLIPSQHCQILGTQGDVFLVDWSKYITLTKGDGIQTAMSMHLFFDYNVSTFRFNFRLAGQPWLSTSITSAYGSFTQSPFVTLDTRS
jgi:HK97 family phage major capsid protein